MFICKIFAWNLVLKKLSCVLVFRARWTCFPEQLYKGRQGWSSHEYCWACDGAGLCRALCWPHLQWDKRGRIQDPWGGSGERETELPNPSSEQHRSWAWGVNNQLPQSQQSFLNLLLLHLNMLHQLKLKGCILHFHWKKPFNSPKHLDPSHYTLLLPTLAGKFLLPPSLRGTSWLFLFPL